MKYPTFGTVPRDEFIKANFPLVWSVVNRFTRVAASLQIEPDDLFGWGCIGLVKAYDRFDPSNGVAWTTYAIPTIYGEIRNAIRDNCRSVTETRTVVTLSNKIKKNMLEDQLPETIVRQFGVSLREAKRALKFAALSFVSTDFQLDDEGRVSVTDLLRVQDDDSVLTINEFIDGLPEKYRKIIRLRMKGYTQNQIAAACNTSQVMVSRTLCKIKQLYQTG